MGDMRDLVVDDEAIEQMREALGFNELENNFMALLAYCHELHNMVEALAGEPVSEADVKITGGPGKKLTIQRNISKMPSPAQMLALRLPKPGIAVKEQALATVAATQVSVSERK